VPAEAGEAAVSRQRERVRRVNAKRPPMPAVEFYPIPANDRTEDLLDYIAMLLDERDAAGKG
jgi:hypothetical protein